MRTRRVLTSILSGMDFFTWAITDFEPVQSGDDLYEWSDILDDLESYEE